MKIYFLDQILYKSYKSFWETATETATKSRETARGRIVGNGQGKI